MTVKILSKNKSKHKALVTNPIDVYKQTDKIYNLVSTIIEKEFPMLKNNSLLQTLVLSRISENIKLY